MFAQMMTRSDAFMKNQEQINKNNDLQFKNQQAALLDLQRTVGGIAQQLQEHPPGQFSGNTFPNPANQSAKAITTRSGKSLGEVVREREVEVDREDEVDEEIEVEAPGKVHTRLAPASTAHAEESPVEQRVERQPTRGRPAPVIDHSRLPFPARARQQKYAQEYGKFLEMFTQLKINLPFIEALQAMPKYAKFLKDLLKRKERIGELSNIPLTGGCSAVVLNKLPEKLTDPGTFTIPCFFGGATTPSHALADLGASINLMPFSLYERLGLGELTPTRMSLSLADRSVKYPRGVVENLLVKVDRFVFPVDFVVLDMEADERVPIILGRPFFRTAKAIIDVFDGKISLRAGDEVVTFEIDRAMQHPSCGDDVSGPCHSVYFLNSFISCVDTCFEYISGADLVGEGVVDEQSEDEIDEVEEECLDESDEVSAEPLGLDAINDESTPVEIPPPLELKVLPSHLEYAFLGEKSDMPVIISSKLTEEEKSRLIEVLREHSDAIAWRLSDIKGISPTFCTHRILMEDVFKPVVQPQRRLNPNMQEVVKKEVMKLLASGLIYPIFDSAWVSPTQVVPKKGGMTVVLNSKNELIPSRTVTGWRVCIDYRKLNDATRKDHFPLPFIDQMLERLAGQQFYCFLDGFSGYFQIPIAPEDQEKTTFTCPYGTYAYRRMPFGLCNAPATFQRCMIAIFQDMVESSMECLVNLERMLKRCVETKLMLNWEKCHFMVTEGIVLGHKISRAGIEVDRAKIDTISQLPPPTSVKSVRSFLGHAGFYRRFIRDFSKITRPMTRLLEKDVPFVFDEECLRAFEFLKERLVSAPILVSPDWSLPFELMCDASDYAVGAVLGQRREKHFHPIYYASKTLNDAQENYTTTEKELLAVVFAFDKFRSYLVLSKTVVFTDNSALRHLFQKKDAKPRLIRWILLLSEFDIEIKDKKGAENVAADHLSRLEDPKREEIREEAIGDRFPHESIDAVTAGAVDLPWFSDIANYLADGFVMESLSLQEKCKLTRDARKYIWDDPYLFRIGGDRVLRRCVSRDEGEGILRHVHEGLTGGHHGAHATAQKVFDCGFYWPTVVDDAAEFVRKCDRCQRTGNISSKDEMPQNPIQVLEVFDVWGIDFMGPFPSSSGNRYILVAIDYVSKWVEAQASPTNDARVVVRFLKKLFTRFGTPRAIISDRGTHFCNAVMEKALERYGVTHRLSTAYHPQTSGQVEIANRGVKRILEKTVGKSRQDWSDKLDDALWAFRTAYKTPLGTTPFMIVYGKSCHLPVELEHRALWALKTVNLDLTEAARRRFFQIHELEALRDAAYDRSWSIKEKSKALHDRRLRKLKEFKVGDRVLLFNSRLKLIAGKLKSRWSGPYVVKEVFPYGTVELFDEESSHAWKVNGHRLKHYIGGPIDTTEEETVPLSDPPSTAP
ncbi:putative nucleotidyltransferase, Ribonuclease H [Helianthus debilis subsp. tardiflorus]